MPDIRTFDAAPKTSLPLTEGVAAEAAPCLELNSLWKGFAGFGSQKLHTLAAYALRKNLMAWLELYDVRLTEAEEERTKRQLREVRHLSLRNSN